MIDLSHLTEEEQGVIMMVLRRDLELKKSEGERIRKLEKVLNSGSQSDSKLKYLTGEWFYEAKSRRHTDKIHGSDIILASMKQRKAAGLDGSLRIERSRIPSSRATESVPPSKPSRCLEATQPQQINDAEKENPHSGLRSPRTPRHNPFNRASLILVEPPDSNIDMSPVWDQVSPKTELASPLKNPPRGELGQTSGGSVTSEGSSAGFRPVPKKRTFLSRRTCSQSESNDQGLDAQSWPDGVVPAPRRSPQQDSSGCSNQSYNKSRDETSQQPLRAVSQVSSNSSLEVKTKQPSTPRDRLPTNMGAALTENETPQKRGDAQTQRERVGVKTVILPSDVFQDSGNENASSVVKGIESSTQSIVDPDPPVSYDLNFIDNADQQAQYKSNPKHAFKLSTQATSPTGNDEDSIAKVLDWFNRSTDSSDWLRTQEDSRATKSSEKHAEINKIKHEDSLRNDTGGIYRREEERSPFQTQTNEALGGRGTDTIGNKQQNEEMMADIRGRMQPQDVKDNDDDWQSPKISHLKSFWEKSNNGPKILISKSVTPSDGVQKAAHRPGEKDEESVNEQHGVFNMPCGMNASKGHYDKYASNHVNDRDQEMAMSSQTDSTDKVHPSMNSQDHLVINATANRNNHDPTHSRSNPQDGRGSDTALRATRLGPQPRTAVQSRASPEYQNFSSVEPNQQPYDVSQFQEASHQEELPTTMSRNSLNTACNQDENDAQVTPEVNICRRSSSDTKRMNSEDKDSNCDEQGLAQGSTAERIKQLRSFWEQEMNKPNKPKTLQVGKFPRGANQARLNKRFTKSEYDLRSVGNDSDSDAEDSSRRQHQFTVLPLSQRMENSSPSLSVSRTNFTSLREFWDEAAAETKAPSSFDKHKPPKRKEAASGHMQCQEFKWGHPEVYSTVDKPRPAMKSPPQNRSKSPHNRQTGSGTRASDGKNSSQPSFTTTESKRSSKEFNRDEKLTKLQITSGKEAARGRKDSFGNSSSRSSLRRATSMFALSGPDERDQCRLKMDVSPIQSQSRKERQSKDKGAAQRRASAETEAVTPLARAFVPRDYRHYLGMTDSSSVHASPAPPVKEEGSGSKSGCEFDLSSPVRASTPVCSEERHSRKANRTSQRPLWATHSSSDAGQDSSLSSTSDTRSISRNASNRENDHESHNPVRKALKRAEARPRNLAKSLEDITASSSARQERRQEPPADLRRISDASTIPSNSSSLFSDPNHLKEMSKSVPSFLQKEDADIDTDSTFEDHRGELTKGRSMSNLTNSSGMASVSSLSGSVMTMYSGDFGNIEVQGNIQFSINYIQRLKELNIFVVECRDLAAVDQKRARSDPYVKSYLVPDKVNLGKRKTSVKKKTLNPNFNEILRYHVRMEDLRTQTLILSVWHHDTFGRNSFLGEVDVDLSNWDFDRTQMNYLALKPRNILSLLPSNDRGEMRLAIRFLSQINRNAGIPKGSSSFGEIHIWVKECKNLPLVRNTVDPYVKCFVLPDTSRKSRQKTRVLRRTADPVFNHTMVYDGIREVDLTEACVELTVWDRDRLASNLLGGLRLGSGTGRSYGAAVDWMDSTSYEVALWERMMASSNEWVEGVLPLRMLNCAKTALK